MLSFMNEHSIFFNAHLLQLGFNPSHFTLDDLQPKHALCILDRLSLFNGFIGRVCKFICLDNTSDLANDLEQNVQLDVY